MWPPFPQNAFLNTRANCPGPPATNVRDTRLAVSVAACSSPCLVAALGGRGVARRNESGGVARDGERQLPFPIGHCALLAAAPLGARGWVAFAGVGEYAPGRSKIDWNATLAPFDISGGLIVVDQHCQCRLEGSEAMGLALRISGFWTAVPAAHDDASGGKDEPHGEPSPVLAADLHCVWAAPPRARTTPRPHPPGWPVHRTCQSHTPRRTRCPIFAW